MENIDNSGNTKRKLKKEYIPLLIAILVLIILVLSLIIVVFYKDDKGLKVPKLPEAEAMNVGIFDIKSGKYEANSFDSADTKKTKVNYKLITDYYTNGVLLTSPEVKYSSGEFLLYSGYTAIDPYVSSIDKDGKLKWLNKISTKGYDSLKVANVIRFKEYYYVFCEGKLTNGKREIVAIKINNKGAEDKRTVLLSDTSNRLREVLEIDNGFAIILDGSENIKIITMSPSMSMLQNVYSITEDKNNQFNTGRPVIKKASYKDKNIMIVVSYENLNDTSMFMINYDTTKRSSTITRLEDLNKLGTKYTNSIYENNGIFYTVYNKKLYQFDSSGKLVLKFDYNNVKVTPEFIETYESQKGNDSEENKKIEESKKKVKNDLEVSKIVLYDDVILVTSETATHFIYDIFDKDVNLQKRYVLSIEEYNHESEEGKNVGLLLDVLYINGKLYKFHSYGSNTPSIMISIVG